MPIRAWPFREGLAGSRDCPLLCVKKNESFFLCKSLAHRDPLWVDFAIFLVAFCVWKDSMQQEEPPSADLFPEGFEQHIGGKSF